MQTYLVQGIQRIVCGRRRARNCGIACAVLLNFFFASGAALAEEGCKVVRQAVLPITMEGSQPIIAAKIDGQDAPFILDSGAFYSSISLAMAQSLGLHVVGASPFSTKIHGIGGSRDVQMATVKRFEFAGIQAKDIQFLVGGSALGGKGLLGQNLLASWDVEYDLAKGNVTLFTTTSCLHSNLAYWKTPDQSLSVMEFTFDELRRDSSTLINESVFKQVEAVVYVNHVRMRAMLDTGSWSSILTLHAAGRAGVKPSSEGAAAAGAISGVGRGAEKVYIGKFDSIQLGDNEEIKNVQLKFADIGLDVDMLLGADFFLSHHVFVSRSNRRIFITYNGGPVFNLAASRTDTVPQAQTDSSGSAQDPETLMRRGAASAARHDYTGALADFNDACRLQPENAECFYERARTYTASGNAAEALNDLDRALTLRADFMPAMMPRAELRQAKNDRAGAVSDLDAFSRLAAKQADERLQLGILYQRSDQYKAAIEQFDLWLSFHLDDSKVVTGLKERCTAKALQNTDLEGALKDCNHALDLVNRSFPTYHALYGLRGLVRLRQAGYDAALQDFNDALKQDPKNVLALYGRGIARIRKGDSAGGNEDIETAKKISQSDVDPLIRARF